MTARKHSPAMGKRRRLLASDLFAKFRTQGHDTTIPAATAQQLVWNSLPVAVVLSGTCDAYKRMAADAPVRLVDVAVYIARRAELGRSR